MTKKTKEELKAFIKKAKANPQWLKEKLEPYFPRIEKLIRLMTANLYFWEQAFKKEQNPLSMWRIYFECRKAKAPIPEFVFQYFDEVAKNICILAANPPEAAERPIELAKTFGLYKDKPGQKSTFTEYNTFWTELLIYFDIKEKIKEYEKEYVAFEIIGEEKKISFSTARRIYKKYAKRFQELP